jgi:hypothetical protein
MVLDSVIEKDKGIMLFTSHRFGLHCFHFVLKEGDSSFRSDKSGLYSE